MPARGPAAPQTDDPASPRSTAVLSFYRQNGVWPGASDAERHPDLLSGRSVMLRCFGSTHGGEIRGIAESILRAAGI